jgi:hypothetical protein
MMNGRLRVAPSVEHEGRNRFQSDAIADGFCHVRLVLDDQHLHAPMLPAGTYRQHIENQIRAGNTSLP